MINTRRLRTLLHYTPETGVFKALVPRGSVAINSIVGSLEQGYLRIMIDRKRYFLHRLAWQYVYGTPPPEQIDHINGNTLDNRISNLRLATANQNQANSKLKCTNRSGFKGVSWNKASEKWVSFISHESKNHNLGYFMTPHAAHAAYSKAAKALRGDFARSK